MNDTVVQTIDKNGNNNIVIESMDEQDRLIMLRNRH